MRPGTIVYLVKSVTTRCGGILATYKLDKEKTIPVIVLSCPADGDLPEVKAALAAIQRRKS